MKINKKVLLRERKRHTDRRVSSTPSVIRGGVPPPTRSDGGGGRLPDVGHPPVRVPLVRVPPVQVWQGGVQVGHPRSYPPPGWLDLAGYPPSLARSDRGGGGGYLRWYPPPSWLDLARYPPSPPPQVWTDKQSETITSHLVLRTRSVNKVYVTY